jgi:hypothetical protein
MKATPNTRTGLALLLAATMVQACDSNAQKEDTFVVTYSRPFDAGAFVDSIANPFMPLAAGTLRRYRGQTEDGIETVEVEVLAQTRTVAGVTARVVRDRVFLDGELFEDTSDWFAQDAEGNVWYLGEESKEYENGQVVSTAGSWEAGVDGAEAGIVMPAAPQIGQAYRQEYYAGEAEDRAEVLATGESVSVPGGSFTGCIRTADTTPLEPDVVEHKTYCPGVGVVLEVNLEDGARLELVEIVLPEG